MMRGEYISDTEFWLFPEAHGLKQNPSVFLVSSLYLRHYAISHFNKLQKSCNACKAAGQPCLSRGKSTCLYCWTQYLTCEGGSVPEFKKEDKPNLENRLKLLADLDRLGHYKWPVKMFDRKGKIERLVIVVVG
jgi:hypothetical protein